ncbi:cytochrome b/b6 domain-containing protein [Paracraurococcus ruber]|uniref:Thioredoxin reductase n=1 Tax=Paracraurococcus ruber TaxID=77675 RepID=A0ABS1CVF5_9PROT|nr:cytochrome b/b6 domain-containing protein [Paracraurococcus ruber]MBK1658221.1 thioredoxin reductase [Paracraurococcus ruber]TDG29447.1 cytochrome b/b6 domain-containing protein [Paracraurococcus ruber]
MRHPLLVRITHWINAFAMVCMSMSGWGIYNASPFFGFRFPAWATLGGWLGGSIAWHLAVMWLLVANGLVYGLFGVLCGHFRRRLLPLRPREMLTDIVAALQLRLAHRGGTYNAVQRASYVGVLLLGLLILASGLALWKPVQLQVLAQALGGYEAARRIHFLAMAGIVAFAILHLAMVALVPRTLPGMITGGAPPKGVP